MVEDREFLTPVDTRKYCNKNRKVKKISDDEILECALAGMSTHETAKKLGVSQNHIYKRAKLIHGLVWQQGNKDLSKIKPSKAELLRRIKMKSTPNVGKDLGCSGNTVRKWCREYGINLRDVRGYKR